MTEKSRNTRRIRLEATEIGAHFMDDIPDRKWEIAGVYALFEPMIQIFIRIAFRSVRRKEKDL